MSIANTEQKTIIEEGIIDENDQTRARIEHLRALETKVGNAYPNKFERSRITGEEDTITNVVNFAPVAEIVRELKDNTPEGEKPNSELKERLNSKLKDFGNVRVSGRLAVPPRVMGKAAFVHLSDGVERLQIYVRKQDAVAVSNDTGKEIEEDGAAWEVFGFLDHGDFIGVEGYLFLTNTGELSVHVEKLQFLAKALLPMPDKMHGIHDPEIRQRQRYADLIGSSLQIEHEGLTTREVFERRAKVISSMRRFLEEHGYIEVETPMLTPKATGAAAKPFETHHNALDITLYARIAPELYLKRLVVGGFEKVYELNRNFRNEGISYKHNPEFTMLEFYCAYMDVNGMMDFCEELLTEAIEKVYGSLIVYTSHWKEKGPEIDFSRPWKRLSMKEAILSSPMWKQFAENGGPQIDENWLEDGIKLERLVRFYDSTRHFTKDKDLTMLTPQMIKSAWEGVKSADIIPSSNTQTDESSKGLNIQKLFEEMCERNLINPTFIIDFPKAISPLSKASPENPQIAERFELFINGMECANGFSELNDPQEQYERFIEQMRERERGDEEAMVLDEDYIRALAYGMPPAAGIGIGIDRLVMLLTNCHSIRDVILFPHLRPERRDEEKKGEEENEAANA